MFHFQLFDSAPSFDEKWVESVSKAPSEHLPALFEQGLAECRAKRLALESLIKVLKQTSGILQLGLLSKEDKLFIYNNPTLLEALLDKVPTSIEILKEVGLDGQNMLVKAVMEKNLKVAKIILNNQACKKTFLETTYQGYRLLELATGPYHSIDMAYELVKAGAPMSLPVYKKLTDFSHMRLDRFEYYKELHALCQQDYHTLREEAKEEAKNEESGRDALATLITIAAPFVVPTSINKETLTELKKSLKSLPNNVIKNAHEIRISDKDAWGSDTWKNNLLFLFKDLSGKIGGERFFDPTSLFLFKYIGGEGGESVARLFDPSSLAKLYYLDDPGSQYTHSGMSLEEKNRFIEQATPHVGFMLLVEHFQSKIEHDKFTSSSSRKFKYFCEIIHALTKEPPCTEKKLKEMIEQACDEFSEQHDFPHMLSMIRQLPFDEIKRHAKNIDQYIRENMGPLLVQYSLTMNTFHKIIPKEPLTVDEIFRNDYKEIFDILKKYGNSDHTWLTYTIQQYQTDMPDTVVLILDKISKWPNTTERAYLQQLINMPGENKRTPLDEAVRLGSFKTFVYLLNLEGTNPGDNIKQQLPFIFLRLLREYRYHTFSQNESSTNPLLIKLLKAPVEFKFPPLSRQDKLYIYNNEALLKAVLERKPPEIDVFTDLDEKGQNVLSKAVEDSNENLMNLILGSEPHKKSFVNRSDTALLCFNPKMVHPKFILPILRAAEHISEEVYLKLTDISLYHIANMESYSEILKLCKERRPKIEFDSKITVAAEKENELLSKIIRYALPQYNRNLYSDFDIDKRDFEEFKLGSIQNIHLKFINNGQYLQTIVPFILCLPSGLLRHFISLLEPKSLAKLYFQQRLKKRSDEEAPQLERKSISKVKFARIASEYAGFFLLYEYFNDKLSHTFSRGTQKKFKVFCQVISYLNTADVTKDSYADFLKTLEHFDQVEFPNLLQAMNELPFEDLKRHAEELHKYIISPACMSKLKLKYLETVEEIELKRTQSKAKGKKAEKKEIDSKHEPIATPAPASFDKTILTYFRSTPPTFDEDWLSKILRLSSAKDILGKHPDHKNHPESEHTSLTYMVEQNNRRMVLNILACDHGKDLLNKPGEAGRTPIEEAYLRGNLYILVCLLGQKNINITPIQEHLPQVFSEVLLECRAGRLRESVLIDLLRAPVNFTLPQLTRDDKLFIYSHPDIFQALLDRKPFLPALFEDYSEEGMNCLTMAVVRGDVENVIQLLSNEACKNALLGRSFQGHTLLEHALLTEKRSVTILLMLLKSGAPLTSFAYVKLTDFTTFRMDISNHYDFVTACREHKEAGAIREEQDRLEKEDERDVWFFIIQHALKANQMKEFLSVDDQVGIWSGNIINNAHEKRFASQWDSSIRSALTILKDLSSTVLKEIFFYITPLSLAKLYHQQIVLDGFIYEEMTKSQKDKFIEAATPKVGFLLLKEHFQTKYEHKQFSSSTQEKFVVFCKIINYLLTTISNDDKAFLKFVDDFKELRSNQHDFPKMFGAIVQLLNKNVSIQTLRKEAIAVDEHIKEHMGPLKVNYLKTMRAVRIKSSPSPAPDMKSLTGLDGATFLATIKQYRTTMHTWPTYAVSENNFEMLRQLIQKIDNWSVASEKAPLVALLNTKNKEGRSPIEEAHAQGNLEIMVYLLNHQNVVVGEKIKAALPAIFLDALKECRAGSVSEKVLIDLLSAPHEFAFPELSKSERLFIYNNPTILQAVLKRRPPELKVIQDLDLEGNHALTKAIREEKEEVVDLILASPPHQRALINQPVLSKKPSEWCQLQKNHRITLSVLKKDPEIDLLAYQKLTDVFEYHLFEFKDYENIREACHKIVAGVNHLVAQPEETTINKTIMDAIFSYIVAKRSGQEAKISVADFKDCKPGSIKDIHLKRINHGDRFIQTPLFLFKYLDKTCWKSFMSLIEPHDLAKLYFQKSYDNVENLYESELSSKDRVSFVAAAVPYTGFFLFYEYFNEKVKETHSHLTEGTKEKLTVFCKVIRYLIDHSGATDSDYQKFCRTLPKFSLQMEFPNLMNAINLLPISELRKHALAMDAYIRHPDHMGDLKVYYIQAMEKIKPQYLQKEFKSPSMLVTG